MIEAVNGSLHRDSRRDYPGVARWPSGQHRRRNRVGRVGLVPHRFCGVWDLNAFVPHGFWALCSTSTSRDHKPDEARRWRAKRRN